MEREKGKKEKREEEVSGAGRPWVAVPLGQRRAVAQAKGEKCAILVEGGGFGGWRNSVSESDERLG